ncbi:TPA: type II toxin-antitoxin system MqsA family antitoxin [Citrobacter koseri]|nr:type II toxin-antitoxin system MqsA family antitoxin [Citrobacter koseri]
MKNLAVCPICGEGHLTMRMEMDEITYKGKTKQITDIYYICDHCHVEQSGAKELKNNKRTMNEFKKEVDGLLTGKEVFEIRSNLGLTQDQASLVFGGGPKAFSKYETDDVIQSESMDNLIRVAAAQPAAFEFLCKRSGIKRKEIVSEPKELMFSFNNNLEEFSVKTAYFNITQH